MSTALATARTLHQRLYPGRSEAPSRHRLFVPRGLTVMGPLARLEVRRPRGRIEQWDFRPRPMLAFTRSGRLWSVGGNFVVDASGFRNLSGPSPLTHRRTDRAPRGLGVEASTYARTHGGLPSREAVEGELEVPEVVVNVGDCHATTYWADKNDGWRGNHRHPFKHPPTVATSPSGRSLYFVGGSYTVTPHGIEDLEP